MSSWAITNYNVVGQLCLVGQLECCWANMSSWAIIMLLGNYGYFGNDNVFGAIRRKNAQLDNENKMLLCFQKNDLAQLLSQETNILFVFPQET